MKNKLLVYILLFLNCVLSYTQNSISRIIPRIIKRIIFISIIGLLTFGCKSTSKKIHKKYLEHLQSMDDDLDYEYLEELRKKFNSFSMDSLRANTSDFYDIEICSKPNKKVFSSEEEKLFSMEITNYGTKELYMPEWFRTDKNIKNAEMTIEIYRKEKDNYKNYVQKKMKTDIFIHGGVNISKRVVFESSGGKHISYENIWIDTFKKIVDEGSYKAKIYIDLSNFGYFKILETEIFFEVMD